ncbi:hypothetical protein GYMLUDRAFT_47990 [Collybiopsis luxurians FD-317 M1]|uniref:Unplaced genomic scaffold GYMLUscaffold_60, whole genome shotgun sequence n=1 Tax=Collybiopsis luxurians FD-317 M1 TaxID=944289 RepID=A0A0D0CJQ1_9AGAR|nr:hypothetical protein GYMLUDRAFT_47990 [Collybiopsis luxurians FD-317 M1]
MQGIHSYGQSKTGNILFSNELAKRYGERGIVSISVHPGSIRTELGRHAPQLIMRLIHWAFSYPVEFGGLGPLYAATAPECSEYNGKVGHITPLSCTCLESIHNWSIRN